ncbi:MAG TPA: TonB-dependent receptor, partial [Fodinibius sp.]|nr:TonB-dependent receptor [Fodinibius sp.]
MQSKSIITIIAFFLLSLLSRLATAQSTASVSGYIVDAKSGETLISANIAIKDSKKGSSTNAAGYFSLPDLEPGSHTLLVSYIGYRRYEKQIALGPGESRRIDIELIPEDYRLDELVVESEIADTEQHDIGKAELKTDFIKKVPSVFQADVFRSLQLLPGIKAASDFSSGLYIRGGSPDQTLILLDRTTVYNPTHFFGFFSTFNPDAIKDIQLYKGGYPAKYGGRLGSVLSIYNKDGNRNEFEGSITLGMLASRISAEGPLKNGSWMLAARRSTLDPLLAVLRKSQENIPESFYFWDLNGKINYDANANNKLSLAFYTGTDDLRLPFSDDANVSLNYGNQTLSATWTHIFSDNVFSNFTATGSRYFNYPSFNIGGTPFERSNNIYDFSLKGDIDYYPNDRHDISAGFWVGLLTLKLQDTFDKEDSFQSHIQSQYSSLYFQDEWTLSEKWSATPGIRLNGFSEGNYLRPAPRLSLEFRPSESIRLQAAYGRYHQFLTLASNEAFTGFDVWLTADDGVPPASGSQYLLGIKTIPRENYNFDAEIYYRSMENLFEPDPFLPDKAGVPYEKTFRFGKGYALGAEFLLKRNTGRLSGFIGYTFSITRRKFPGFNEPIGSDATARSY